MLKKDKMKLRIIIILVFVTITLVGSMGGSYYFYIQSVNVLEKQVQNHLQTTAENRAHHIDTYLKQNIERLKLINSKTQLKRHLENYIQIPDELLKQDILKIINDAKGPIQEFERICVIPLGGVILCSTDENFIGQDVHERDFFIQGQVGENIYFMEENGEQKLFVSGPFIKDGNLLGVGITVVNMGSLEEIVKDRSGLQETGEVLVTIQGEDERIYLFERLLEEEALKQTLESEATAEPMKQALVGNELFFENTLDYRDEEVIAFSQYVETGKMGLVAKIDRAEAIGVLKKEMLKEVFISAGIMAFLAILIGFFMSRLIIKPIKKLTQNVDEITKGKLDIQLSKSKIYEIQKLTDSLNRILASLKLAVLKTGIDKGELGLGEAVKAKEEAEEKYKILYESSSDAIMVIEPPTWNFTSGNPSAVKMFDAKDEKEFTSKNPGELSPEKQEDGELSSDRAKKMIMKAMKEGSNSFYWTHKRINGEKFLAQVLLTKFKFGGKDVLQATVRDLSGKKVVEKKVVPVKKIVKPVVKTLKEKSEKKVVSKLIKVVDGERVKKKIVKPIVKKRIVDKKVSDVVKKLSEKEVSK